MKSPRRIHSLSLVSAALLAVSASLLGCSSLPSDNLQLDRARSDYRSAQADPQTAAHAASEMKLAREALDRANSAWAAQDASAKVDHLAFLAQQQVAIAQETTRQKLAEAAVSSANAQRDQIRLQARTQEADRAGQAAGIAQAQAAQSQQDNLNAQAQTVAVQLQAQNQAEHARIRTYQLETQIRELHAKQTERGLVITIGDVLFDNNRAELKSGAQRDLERLSVFLKTYPERRVRVEGYADSVGSSSSNESLSGRRAESVRSALLALGVEPGRVVSQAMGETHPVASNDNAAGRQQNRRVEIVLSDESGVMASR